MLRPNRVETTKRPGNFCVWTLAVWAPPACETLPRSRLRWPEAPPVKAAPSGALTKFTGIAPSLADFLEIAVCGISAGCCNRSRCRVVDRYASHLPGVSGVG